ncbi:MULTISPECIES: hypothetical protein [unclassified Coleofasciculus]|uniref:hypothetical protein n=1 Tax=unclassified Coleofasciculus TaxID=2692782 RepID=UPI0018814F12|nr:MULTISPECIES: hypothetical protein [unclassified Coleofasciculus]MBE9124765.1 hypothetical protein [Coleofasciculus sp. LEGE 07081]MBE9148217.1 hypothetical protein [Coleofasciculus sp. LEGE 07092]
MSKNKWLTVKLRADPDSPLGKVIAKVQAQPLGSENTVVELLFMHFSAEALDLRDEQQRHVAVRYTERCLADAIASKRLLGIDPNPYPIMMSHSQHNGSNSSPPQEQEEKEGFLLNHSSESMFG